MSDIGPLVARVLKDRAMVEMTAELEKLRRLVDDRLKVQITGKKGTPVYREGSLKDGYTSHRGRCFEVVFEDAEGDDGGGDGDDDGDTKATTEKKSPGGSIPLTAIGDMEIRLGGTVLQHLDADTMEGSCNLPPFFTDDDFYRDTRYNKPQFLAPDRMEIVLRIDIHKHGPVPVVFARFGNEMDLRDYGQLNQLDMEDLVAISDSGKASTIILEGLTFSKPDIQKVISVLGELGYDVDEGNSHRYTVDAAEMPARKRPRTNEDR